MKRIMALVAVLSFGQMFFAQPAAMCGDEPQVYICSGGSTKRYHQTDRCRGLGSCSKEIMKVDKSVAEGKDLTPCKLCYKK